MTGYRYPMPTALEWAIFGAIVHGPQDPDASFEFIWTWEPESGRIGVELM